MARPKRELDADLEKEMKTRAKEWRKFMSMNLFTQAKLADLTGISRRTIQCVVAGAIIPQDETLQAFTKLQDIYEEEGKPTGKRKRNKVAKDGEVW